MTKDEQRRFTRQYHAKLAERQAAQQAAKKAKSQKPQESQIQAMWRESFAKVSGFATEPEESTVSEVAGAAER